ncbi:Fe-S protein assembly co-chaperone HscB [Neisseria yangbaofengii]|uniref:Fe-S protein assembly co-chaperone HscB n=1 Tax=Neisseria yangbaofengii TaxID=2709396 RepID=UPI0013EA990A|nr:Fe-S protein assembly co-chaperone HscB [Neisseria yangbaofengii]
MNQYFDLFQLPVQFDLDEQKLEQTYRDLAARFHPDKFAAASAFEQKQAVMMSATINEAYQTLKNPIDRASCLLKAQNIEADAPEHTAFAPEFLMQQMEWRETLMDAQTEQNQAAIAVLDEEVRNEQQSLFAALNSAFAKEDYDNAAQLVRHGRFLNKLRSEIAAAL